MVDMPGPAGPAHPMNLSAGIANAVARKGLRPRGDLHEPGWTFWELKNLNMHRVVGLLEAQRTFSDVLDLEGEIRGTLARDFKRAWWRGLACGVVAEVSRASWTLDDVKVLVDSYENRRGVLQWVVLISSDTHSAIGVHTWEQVFLSQIYRETLGALTTDGYHVSTAVRGKDGLLKFLTGVSELRGVSFPEFRDPPDPAR